MIILCSLIILRLRVTFFRLNSLNLLLVMWILRPWFSSLIVQLSLTIRFINIYWVIKCVIITLFLFVWHGIVMMLPTPRNSASFSIFLTLIIITQCLMQFALVYWIQTSQLLLLWLLRHKVFLIYFRLLIVFDYYRSISLTWFADSHLNLFSFLNH